MAESEWTRLIGGDTDVELESAPWIEEPQTVLGLLAEMKDRHLEYEPETFLEAALNERFVAGRQALDVSSGSINDLDEDGVKYPTRNLLRNFVLTWSARILEDRPSVKAWPNDASLGDKAKTDIANAVIAHQYARQDLDAMMARAAKLAQMHTCCAFKTAWDPDVGPRGPGMDGESVALGEISIDLKSIFDYITDGSEFVKDSAWCAFRSYVDMDTARALLWEKFENPEIAPNISKRETMWSGEKDGVVVWEMWYRPGPRFPNGLFAVVVGGHVVDSRPFPYAHGELPIAIWKIGSKRDHPAGDSHVSDARKIQQDLNQTLNNRRKIERAFANAARLVGPKSLMDQVDADDAVISHEDPNWKAQTGYIDPPSTSLSELDARTEDHMAAMGHVFGLNEAISGADNAKGTSGRAIAYLKELDSQKLSEASRNLGEALRRIFRQTLRLTQQFVVEERLVAIAGDGAEMKAQAFRGAELEGIDIILEPTSGAERWRAAQVGQMEERMAAGFEDPARVAQLRDTGLDVTASEQWQRERIQTQIMQAMEGHVTPPDPQIDPRIATEEIRIAAEVAPEAGEMLERLLAGYQQAAAAKQQRAAAQGAPKPGGPKKPPARPQLMKQEAPTSAAGLPKLPPGGA